MTEIEKMYKNANVQPVCDGIDCYTCTAECNNGQYPDFTAEKQIELIKWIAKKKFVVYDNLGGLFMGIMPTYNEELGIVCKNKAMNIDFFEEALAKLINSLWQNLTSEEKQQIKEILE